MESPPQCTGTIWKWSSECLVKSREGVLSVDSYLALERADSRAKRDSLGKNHRLLKRIGNVLFVSSAASGYLPAFKREYGGAGDSTRFSRALKRCVRAT